MGSREDAHRLLDAIPEARLPVIEQVLRASLDGPLPAPPRRFSSAGTLSAEHDLACGWHSAQWWRSMTCSVFSGLG
jgi:hypothetical protein